MKITNRAVNMITYEALRRGREAWLNVEDWFHDRGKIGGQDTS